MAKQIGVWGPRPQRVQGRALILCLAWISLAGPARADAQGIKLATWNLDWLTTRLAGDPALPDDVEPKNSADIDNLAAYAVRLDADVIGMQEVDGPQIAARLFPPERYRIEMTNDAVIQRVGIAIRRDFTVTRYPDLTALGQRGEADSHNLRSGLDLSIARGNFHLRLLVVHLKTGCWDRPLSGRLIPSCRTLRHQTELLSAWITARQQENQPFAVMGDFNRNLPKGDDVLEALENAAPLQLATEGHISPCWGGEAFIDHILTFGPARAWMDPSSLRVLVYKETDPEIKDHLSDHCPVSVRLDPER